MAIEHDLNTREHKKFKESTSVAGQVGVVVVNPDGSSIGSGGGGGGDGAINDGVSSTIKATVFDLTNSNPLTVAIVDSSGDQITSFGGGTQYAVDAALGATPTGTLALGIRDDALSGLTPVEGDAVGMRVSDTGALWVKVDSLPASSTQIGNVGIVSGSNVIGRVKLVDDSSGTNANILDLTNSNALATAIVDGNGDQITSFGGGTQYTEDAAAAANPTGTMAMAVRADSLAGVTSTDGDNIALRATDKGEMYVKHTDTVNTELQTGDNVVGRVKLTDGDGNIADIFGLGSSSPLAVALVDADGVQVTSFGGGTQYTEGDTDATITGTAMMWEDGSNTLRAVSTAKPLPVILQVNDGVDVGDVTITNPSLTVVNGSPSALAAVVYGYAQHDSALTGIGPLTAGAYASASAPSAVSSDGDNVFLWADRNGRLQVGDGGQTLSIDDGSGSITIDGTVAATQSGTWSVSTTSAISGIGHGVKTVTTAGTDVVLAASTACKRVTIQAQTDNTGLIAVGGSGVDATVATGTGVILNPGDTYELEIDNLNDVYIDSTVNGDGVRYTYFT